MEEYSFEKYLLYSHTLRDLFDCKNECVLHERKIKLLVSFGIKRIRGKSLVSFDISDASFNQRFSQLQDSLEKYCFRYFVNCQIDLSLGRSCSEGEQLELDLKFPPPDNSIERSFRSFERQMKARS